MGDAGKHAPASTTLDRFAAISIKSDDADQVFVDRHRPLRSTCGERSLQGGRSMSGSITKRKLLRVTAAGVSLAPLLIKTSLAQTLDPNEAEKNLYPAPGLPGGG